MFKIGGLLFSIDLDEKLEFPDHLMVFETNEDGEADYCYKIVVKEECEEVKGELIFNKDNIKVYKDGDSESRLLYFHGDSVPYAYYCEKDSRHFDVIVNPIYLQFFTLDTVFNSCLALEKRMFENGAFIIHSAYMTYQNKAIIFSAPSGTGKSTQADLWTKYRGSYTVNGDRSLLKKDNDHFICMGWPICGSSNICLNESYPLEALVFLSQAPQNTIEKLNLKTALKKMLSELTINYWNKDFVNAAYDFIIDVISHVQIYHLACTPDVNAVEYLEKQMKEDFEWML